MMILKYRSLANLCLMNKSLAKCLQPYPLQLHNSPKIPTLKLKSQSYLIKFWWSESPFEIQQKMLVPVFSFHTNQYLQKSIQLPSQIFNQPLRRDLIYRLYNYRRNLNKFNSKVTRNRAMTAGSGRKMGRQKGRGMARVGQKRAPQRWKGGKAHGAKAVVYSFPLNAKIKLRALCALMSSKLSEGKVKIVDTQSIDQPKTKILSQIFHSHSSDQRTVFCIVTDKDGSNNFAFAQRNLKKVIWHNSYNLDVHSLLVADKIIFTLKGLQEFIESMRKTQYVAYKQPYMPKIPEESENKQEKVEWDPEQPYEFKFKILAEYLELYEKTKQEQPELLNAEFGRIRRVV